MTTRPDTVVAIVDPLTGQPDMRVSIVGGNVVDMIGATPGEVLTVQPDGTLAPEDPFDLDAMRFKGVIDASTNPNYPAAEAGDVYRISVAGKIGGASGTTVEVGDLILAVADNAGGTQAAVGSSWSVEQANIDGAVTKSMFDANTVLAATTDDTPAAVTMGASTILARLATGNIVAATVEQVIALLGQQTWSPLTVGQEVMPRVLARDGITNPTGVLRLGYFTARKSETSTQVRVLCTTGYVSTPSLVRFGLYSVAANGDLSLVASTPNDTALLAANTTAYTKAWSASFPLVGGARYAIGILVVTAGTSASVSGVSTANAAENAIAPRMGAILSGQADLPTSPTEASLSATSAVPYAAILP